MALNLTFILAKAFLLLILVGYLAIIPFFQKEKTGPIARIFLSFIFSIILDCLAIIVLYYLGLKINLPNLIISVFLIALVVFELQNYFVKKERAVAIARDRPVIRP